MRNSSEDEIITLVDKAWQEDRHLTLACLLFIRDIRGGLGERRFFQVSMRYLAHEYGLGFANPFPLMDAIVEVGSWKDIFAIFGIGVISKYIKKKMEEEASGEVSLMWKWMPSIGGSRNSQAEELADKLGLTPRNYRKLLSQKRAQLKLVETAMCSKNWAGIEYDKLPSKASLLYRAAFHRHDDERYRAFLRQVMNGEKKINSSTLYPYELTGKYGSEWGECELDLTVEAQWKDLPDYTDGRNALVVADTSGSMQGTPMNVSTSLAIYFAERNKGMFHGEYITFSSRPSFIKFEDGSSLRDKVRQMYDESICDNTNLQAVFDLILSTAKRNHLTQMDMPSDIYVVSDMEFDVATSGEPVTNFEEIQRKYQESGYEMPHLIFWNVDSRQENVPVRYDEAGTALVSGCSPSIFKMATSGDLNPMSFMLSVIQSPRYADLVDKIY